MPTSDRLLRLLSLLQQRTRWSGPELAERLAITPRTVRRDVDRLRTLGYRIEAAPGFGEGSGYRLGTGTALPPLLLDDDEATAIAIALGASAGGAVQGIEEGERVPEDLVSRCTGAGRGLSPWMHFLRPPERTPGSGSTSTAPPTRHLPHRSVPTRL